MKHYARQATQNHASCKNLQSCQKLKKTILNTFHTYTSKRMFYSLYVCVMARKIYNIYKVERG